VVQRRSLGLTRAPSVLQGIAGAAGHNAGGADAVQNVLNAVDGAVHQELAAGPVMALVAQHGSHLGFLIFVPSSRCDLCADGSSNAVNLTDGLDGLAIGCTIIAAGAWLCSPTSAATWCFADYLELQRMPMVGELTVFCGSMVGASIGFLCTTRTLPSFHGGRGLAGPGGAIGTVAIIIRQELLLPFIGGIFILEAVSVVLHGGQLQTAQRKAYLQNGAAASPFRTVRLERIQDYRSLLDRRPGVCTVCTHDVETALVEFATQMVVYVLKGHDFSRAAKRLKMSWL